MYSSALRSAFKTRFAPISRIPANVVRSNIRAIPQVRFYSDHHEETFEEFTARYVYISDLNVGNVILTNVDTKKSLKKLMICSKFKES